MCCNFVEAFSATYRLLVLIDSPDAIMIMALHSESSHTRMGIDRSWAQVLLRYYHGSNAPKLRLVTVLGIRHHRTLSDLVLPVLLLGSPCKIVFLFSVDGWFHLLLLIV